MKKLLALLLACAMFAALLTGCSGSADETGIPAQAFSTGTVLVLPLKAELNEGNYVSYGGHQFNSSKKLEKLENLITKNNESVTATEYENAYGVCALFTVETPSGTDAWCLYRTDPSNTKDQYIFSGLHRELTLPDMQMDILMPLHLISDSHIRDNMGSRVMLNTEYACGLKDADSTLAALFQSFYQSSGLYRITSAENGFILALSDPSSKLQLQFSFSQHDDSDWFTITDATEHEPEPSDTVSVRWTQTADEGEEETAPVEAQLLGDDALQLSALLISLSYSAGSTDVAYPYSVSFDESSYSLRLLWKDNAWSGTVECEAKTSALTTKSASVVAALLFNNGLIELDENEENVAPDGIVPMADCMATTGDVNVRSQPSTSGTILETLPKDSPVAVTARTGDWYQIIFGDQVAYMSAQYLKDVN